MRVEAESKKNQYSKPSRFRACAEQEVPRPRLVPAIIQCNCRDGSVHTRSLHQIPHRISPMDRPAKLYLPLTARWLDTWGRVYAVSHERIPRALLAEESAALRTCCASCARARAARARSRRSMTFKSALPSHSNLRDISKMKKSSG